MSWTVLTTPSCQTAETVHEAYPSCEDLFRIEHTQVKSILQDLQDVLIPDHHLNQEDHETLVSLRHGKTLLILSIGGPAMCAQILQRMAPEHTSQRILFCDTLDDEILNFLHNKPNLLDVRVLIISKSGNTLETNLAFDQCVDILKGRGVPVEKHCVLVTESSGSSACNNKLLIKARAQTIPIVFINPYIDGRFSLFSKVGEIVSFLFRVPFQSFCQGGLCALYDLKHLVETYDDLASVYNLPTQSYRLYHDHVLWTYDPQLLPLVQWWAQLIGESLGKSGHGVTPIVAVGPRDQHSQLQLYLGGPPDKYFTFLCTHSTAYLEKAYASATALRQRAVDHAHDYQKLSFQDLQKKRNQQIIAIQMRAVMDVLDKEGRHARVLHIRPKDPFSVGYMAMRMMMEVIGQGFAQNMNPFGQPDVERVKARTYELLGNVDAFSNS